ncbi:MAG: Dolichyl-phosphate-mannose-protein mannosyltransferase [Actinomycetia bacterium]|nr:Dolichyl-phosphate-mannose-protein mannosyltransferase [Actinomycetes bacterium]
MSAFAYLRGGGALVIAVASVTYACRHLRSLLTPTWHGPLARLAEIVLGLSLVTVLLEVLGTIGLLRPTMVMVAIPLCALAAGRWAAGRSMPSDQPARPRIVVRWDVLLSFGIVVVVLGQWLAHASVIVEGGFRDMDSLRYHGPFVARWVQQHSLVHLEHTSSEVQETFFPANAELLHAYGVLLFGRDILTPFLNLAWYGLGVLAAWCGPVSGRGRAAAAAGFAAVCSTPLLSSIEPGSAKNDLAAGVLVLCLAVFLLHHAEAGRGSMVVAGLAAGLAVGTKLTVLAPLAVLVVGVVWLARGRRRAVVVPLLAGTVVTGSFWYLRNLVHTGNPLPWLRHLGPVRLPGPDMPGAKAHGFSVLHYATDHSFWTQVVPTGLVHSFGPLFPLLLIGAVGFSVLALLERGSGPRLVPLAAVAGMTAYLATPFSAGGSDGHPTLFALDLRFLAPSLLLAVVVAARSARATLLLVASASLVAVNQWSGLGRWPNSDGALRGLALLGLVGGLSVLAVRHVHGHQLLGVGLVLAVVLGAVGWPVQADEVSDRYAAVDSGLTAAFAMFHDTHGLRIAVGGFANDYPLYGAGLDNRVQYIGVPLDHGGFRPATSCREWRGALARGRYDDVVLSRSPLARQRLPREAAWTATDPAAHLVLSRGVTRVYRLRGSMDPRLCPEGA